MSLYSIDNKWVGWVREEDKAVFTANNEYLGTIVHGNRLYYFTDHPILEISYSWKSSPPNESAPGYPGQAPKDDLPDGARDFDLSGVYSIKELSHAD
jgi:hypothetical protein